MTDKKICKIEPTRAEVFENGIVYVKPCGVKYTDKHEVHCKKYADRNCEYMLKEHIKRQHEETIADEILNDLFGGC